MTQVWSCGGGTQSAAIAALIVQGKLPRPDYAIIVDTERENSETWEYLDSVLRPELAKVGLEISRVPKSTLATCDLYSVSGEDLLLPVFTSQNGDGKMSNFCSGEWKREVIKRWVRAQGVDQCRAWVGISLDEMGRVRTPRTKWYQEHYPLIFDVPMRRQDCINLVMHEMGWPEPPRSSCWMCPNKRDAEWRHLKQFYPADFQKAVELEREIRQRDPHAFLHESMVPLDQVDFENHQTTFWNTEKGCSSGYCFT